MEQIGYAIVGDGAYGYKCFGDTFANNSTVKIWELIGYLAIPVCVKMTDEYREFYCLD